MRAALALALMCSLGGAPALAQDFTVAPLDPLDPVDPVDPDQGQSSTARITPNNPDIGLVPTEVNPDTGFATSSQDDIGLFDAPESDAGLVQTRNLRATSNVTAVNAANASAAQLRALDRTVGQTTDFEMAVGETVVIGRLAIQLAECRFPVDNPASDAFAHLTIADLQGRALFDGWMVASSPALAALEHPRYDVWVLSCSTS